MLRNDDDSDASVGIEPPNNDRDNNDEESVNDNNNDRNNENHRPAQRQRVMDRDNHRRHHLGQRVQQPGNAPPVGQGHRQRQLDGLVSRENEMFFPKAVIPSGRMEIEQLRVSASGVATIGSIFQLLPDDDDEDDLGIDGLLPDVEQNDTIDTLTELINKGPNYEGQSSNHLVALVTSMKTVHTVEVRAYNRSNQRRGNGAAQTNKRIIHCMDVNGSQGNNIFAIIIDQHNMNLFSNDITIRDKGYFRELVCLHR